MNRIKHYLILALLAIAAAAMSPARAQNATTYNVTFGGFDNPYMNITVSVPSLPQTFTEIDYYDFNPWQVFINGSEFTSVSVTSGGNGKVSANMVDWSEMTITVTGTFEGTATIHVEGIDDNQEPISCDITVACTLPPQPHTVRLAEGTEDAANWSLASGNASVQGTQVLQGIMSGSELTATYNGTKKVKSVKAVAPVVLTLDLATVTTDTTVGDGYTVTGTLGANVKISIADGATVTLNNASISYSGNGADYAGLTLLGDGTLVLVDGTENNLIGGLDGDGYSNWPGIYVPEGKTLTINGSTGVLNAARGGNDVNDGSPAGIGAAWGSNAGNIVINGGVINATGGGKGAGIGGCGRRGCGYITINGGTVTATGGKYGPGIGIGGSNSNPVSDGGTCGDITITGGTVTATGGQKGAGIGTGYADNQSASIVTKICGNILINGGTVTATGGANAAGIGTGEANNEKGIITVGTITITDGVERVTATAGSGATNSIGVGSGTNATCGTVTVGGLEGPVTVSPYTYQPN